MTIEAQYVEDYHQQTKTAAATLTMGQVVQLASGLAAIVGTNNVVSGDPYTAVIKGVHKVIKTAGTAWVEGDEIFWDADANAAVVRSAALDGSADFRIGIAAAAATSGATEGYVELNEGWIQLNPFTAELDHADTAARVLVPASMNPHGLDIIQFYGEVTEAPAGSSEDQLIITLQDEDDNALATLTTTNTTPDAIGDVIKGVGAISAASTGAVLAKCPARKALEVIVSQATAGTPAGKIVCKVLCRPSR